MILSDNVSTAVNAVSGGVWSRKEGIAFCGNADRVDEVYQEIMDERQEAINMTMQANGEEGSQKE